MGRKGTLQYAPAGLERYGDTLSPLVYSFLAVRSAQNDTRCAKAAVELGQRMTAVHLTRVLSAAHNCHRRSSLPLFYACLACAHRHGAHATRWPRRHHQNCALDGPPPRGTLSWPSDCPGGAFSTHCVHNALHVAASRTNGGTHIDAGDYARGSIRCPAAAVAGKECAHSCLRPVCFT